MSGFQGARCCCCYPAGDGGRGSVVGDFNAAVAAHWSPTAGPLGALTCQISPTRGFGQRAVAHGSVGIGHRQIDESRRDHQPLRGAGVGRGSTAGSRVCATQLSDVLDSGDPVAGRPGRGASAILDAAALLPVLAHLASRTTDVLAFGRRVAEMATEVGDGATHAARACAGNSRPRSIGPRGPSS